MSEPLAGYVVHLIWSDMPHLEGHAALGLTAPAEARGGASRVPRGELPLSPGLGRWASVEVASSPTRMHEAPYEPKLVWRRELRALRCYGSMGLGRVELPTSRLSGVRSNHLSYRPGESRES